MPGLRCGSTSKPRSARAQPLVTTPTPVARRTGPGAFRTGAGSRPLRLRLDRNTTFWGLVLPPAVWLALFFLAPLLLIAVISLRPDLRGGVLASFAPTIDQYRTLLEKPTYLRLFGTFVRLGKGADVDLRRALIDRLGIRTPLGEG